MELNSRAINSKFTYFLLLTLMFGLSTCTNEPENVYTRGNLEIYFSPEMETFVEPLADYFEDNQLIFDHKHSVQLTSTPIDDNGGSIILKMIASEGKLEIPGSLLFNIEHLEKDLKTKVFSGANFRIAVCNANFVEYNNK